MVVTVYSTAWCPDCIRSKRLLQNAGVEFTEIDIEQTPGAEETMRAENGGSGKVPTIFFDGVSEPTATQRLMLIEPTDAELTDMLRSLSISV